VPLVDNGWTTRARGGDAALCRITSANCWYRCVTAVDEFNRFYSPLAERDLLRPAMALSPSPMDLHHLQQQQQQQPPPRQSLDAVSSLPPVNPAMLLPYPPTAEQARAGDIQRQRPPAPALAGAPGHAAGPPGGDAARRRDWLGQCPHL